MSLYSVYVAANTLSRAMNVAHEVVETRPGWKRSLLAGNFGPTLALVVAIALAVGLVTTSRGAPVYGPHPAACLVIRPRCSSGLPVRHARRGSGRSRMVPHLDRFLGLYRILRGLRGRQRWYSWGRRSTPSSTSRSWTNDERERWGDRFRLDADPAGAGGSAQRREHGNDDLRRFYRSAHHRTAHIDGMCYGGKHAWSCCAAITRPMA